ncbi:MAG: hypothetical protein U0836_07570 [Pirellulales bacterium]
MSRSLRKGRDRREDFGEAVRPDGRLGIVDLGMARVGQEAARFALGQLGVVDQQAAPV